MTSRDEEMGDKFGVVRLCANNDTQIQNQIQDLERLQPVGVLVLCPEAPGIHQTARKNL